MILSKFCRFYQNFVGFYQNCVFLYKSCLLYINFLNFINKKNCWFYKKKFVDFIEILKFFRIKKLNLSKFCRFSQKKLSSYYFKSFSLTQIVYSLCTILNCGLLEKLTVGKLWVCGTTPPTVFRGPDKVFQYTIISHRLCLATNHQQESVILKGGGHACAVAQFSKQIQHVVK